MTDFYGADTEALRTLGARFAAHANRIEEIRASLVPVVLNEAVWRGPDAEAFRSRWSSEAYPRLGTIGHDMSGKRGELEQHAGEQDQASEAEGGPSFFDLVKIGTKAFSLYKAGKGLIDHAKDMKRLYDAWRMGPDDFSRVWESLKLRNYMKWGSEGYSKLFGTLAGQLGKVIPSEGFKAIPGDVWKWMGKQVDGFPTKLAEGGKLVEKFGAKLGPEGLSFLSKSSKALGKIMPGVDILVGGVQVATASDGYGKLSGGLSMLSGGLMLAGMAFPPLAVAGAVVGGVSLAMDVVDLVGESFFGVDPSKAVSDAVGSAANAVGETAGKAADAVGDAVSGFGRALGSIF